MSEMIATVALYEADLEAVGNLAAGAARDGEEAMGQGWRAGLTNPQAWVQDLGRRALCRRAVERLALAQLRQDVDAVVDSYFVICGSPTTLAQDVAMILETGPGDVLADPEWQAILAELDHADEEDLAGLLLAYCATRLGLAGYGPQDRVSLPKEEPDAAYCY